jgi:molybdopterin/thiamine biosynthesis adenylyltransferase
MTHRIILVDFDTYDASNLTRQCLGCIRDVGLHKVDVSARNLEFHNLRSRIESLHANILTEWQAVVSLARKSTVLFNCVDIGVMFFFCAKSLSKEFGIPLVCGQSFGWKFMVEYYSGKPDKMCAFCQVKLIFQNLCGSLAGFLITNHACVIIYVQFSLKESSFNFFSSFLNCFLFDRSQRFEHLEQISMKLTKSVA